MFLIFCGASIIAQIILRLWFAKNYLYIHGEQGRDYLVIWRALTQHEHILLGPFQAGTGGLHLGPLYYYLLAPFLVSTFFHPFAGFFMISLMWLSVCIILPFFLYHRGYKTLAVFTLLIMITSETYWVFTTIPLNTAILPFFETLYFISLFKFLERGSWSWAWITAIVLAFLLQSHLSAFFILPALFCCCVLVPKRIVRISIAVITTVTFAFLPILVYDLQHHGEQFHIFLKILYGEESFQPQYTGNAFDVIKTWIMSSLISHNTYAFFSPVRTTLFIVGMCVTISIMSIRAIWRRRINIHEQGLRLFCQHHIGAVMLIITMFFLLSGALIGHTTTVRHFILLFPFPLFAFAWIMTRLWQFPKTSWCAMIMMVGFLFLNIKNVQQEFIIARQYPLDQPSESFALEWREELSFAQAIVHHPRLQHKRILLLTNPENNDVDITMHYLLRWASRGHLHLVSRSQHPDNVLEIQIQKIHTQNNPLIALPPFYALLYTNAEYKKRYPEKL